MYSKGIFERFVDKIEATRVLPPEDIQEFRRRIAEAFFNEFEFCAGQVEDDIFEGHRELIPGLQVQVRDLAAPDDFKRVPDYDRIVAVEPYITDGMIGRFIDALEQEGYDPEKIDAMRMRTIGLRADSLLNPHEPQQETKGVYGVLSAEFVLRDQTLIERFRSERTSLMTAQERATIQRLRDKA